jgi:hypothetical protein
MQSLPHHVQLATCNEEEQIELLRRFNGSSG